MHIRSTWRGLLQPLAAFVLLTAAHAQCDPVAKSTGVFPGAEGEVESLTWWDPDGAGPLGEQLLLAGDFTMVFGQQAAGLALFDPVAGSWQPFAGTDGVVHDAAVSPTGDLVIGGEFTEVDGVPARNVARFDGTTWSPLAGGIPDGHVEAVAIADNGDVFVGGRFTVTFPTGAVAGGVARFDGSIWWSIGNVLSPLPPFVFALEFLPDGRLVAAGAFTRINAVVAASIAAWDGATWSPLGEGIGGAVITGIGEVRALLVLDDGSLLAAGMFGNAGGQPANSIARWDGAAWAPLDPPWLYWPGAQIHQLLQLSNGDVAATGSISLGLAWTNAMRWTGSAWYSMGLNERLGKIAELPNGDLLSFGEHFRLQQSGTTWSELATGTDGEVHAVAALPGGRYLASGSFDTFDGVPAPRLAIYEDGAWRATPPLPVPHEVTFATEMPDGTLVAVADPRNDDPRMYAFRNGAWSAIASFDAGIDAATFDADGNLIVGGAFTTGPYGVAIPGLRRWDGASWTAVDPSFDGTVSALALLPDGRLAVGGELSTTSGGAFGKLAAWDGSSWSPIGGGTTGAPRALAVLTDGTLVAAGNLVQAGGVPVDGIAQWNGNAWQPLGAGILADEQRGPLCMSAQPDGGLLVGGDFDAAGATPASNLARWDGAQWHAFGSGASAAVTRIDTASDGRTIVAGRFASFDALPSAHAARIEPACPAEVSYIEQGQCLAPTLVVEHPPLIGATLQSSSFVGEAATGTFTLSVIGATPMYTQLYLLIPGVYPYCRLLATPDLLDLLVPIDGTVRTIVAVPDDPALVGLLLFHQHLTFANGELAQVRASGLAAMTIGRLW